MVRAVLRSGTICPIDPLPTSWPEGAELLIEPVGLDGIADDPAAWLRDLEAMGNPFEQPGEWEAFQATLAEADREAKEWMRREMGLA